MKSKIIPYHQAYYPSLVELFQLNSPAYFAAEELDDFSNYLQHETEDYFVMQIDHKIVGCGGINYEHEKNTAIISWDILDPAYHAKGYGSKLLKFRINILKNNTSINHIVVRTSQHTFPFYEKNGFITEKVVKNYWAAGFDLYLMNYNA